MLSLVFLSLIFCDNFIVHANLNNIECNNHRECHNLVVSKESSPFYFREARRIRLPKCFVSYTRLLKDSHYTALTNKGTPYSFGFDSKRFRTDFRVPNKLFQVSSHSSRLLLRQYQGDRDFGTNASLPPLYRPDNAENLRQVDTHGL
jgi:hypothetical protein